MIDFPLHTPETAPPPADVMLAGLRDMLGFVPNVFAAIAESPEALRAFVDPEWVAASGAFYEIHPRDVKNFPQEERYYEQAALAPLR